METAGYIIIGAIAERISFAGFLLAELAMGTDHLPDLRQLDLGRRLDGPPRHVAAPGPRRGRLRRLGVVHATGGWAALALAMASDRASASSTRTAAPTPSPATTSATSSSARWCWCSAGWASTRARRSGRPICGSPSSPSTPCWPRASASSRPWPTPTPGTASPTSPCRATACWPGWSPSRHRAPSWRPGRRPSSASSPASSSATASGSSTTSLVDDPCGAISVHGINGAWGVLAVGSSPTARTAPVGTASTGRSGPLLRRRRPARCADVPRRRRLRVGVGRHLAHLQGGQELHADPGLAAGGARGARHARVRSPVLPRLRAGRRDGATDAHAVPPLEGEGRRPALTRDKGTTP